ncbi:MAG: Heat-inducible transcription repressor HrcA [Fimbriimonadaceae bacterium]|nr:Heat-inducible transcription repressor HrcA [Fimbriimonadaceae bacterium]
MADETTPQLGERKGYVLRAVILEYVQAAEPVASETVAQKYDLGVKSATIRNEMAELLDLGYLEQPHTSAGRIPSDIGYRYYVDFLKREVLPTTERVAKLKPAGRESEVLADILAETTRALSRMTQLLSAATTVRNVSLRVKSCILSAVGPDRVLLVVLFQNGHVENRLIECPAGLTLDELGRSNEVLSQLVGDKTLSTLARLKTPSSAGTALVNKLVHNAATSVRSIARDLGKGHVITHGEEYLLTQPEIQRDVQQLQRLIDSLEDEEGFYQMLQPHLARRDVTIGRENEDERLHGFTVVRHRFLVGDEEGGSVALIGPTRFDYDRNIPLLRFTAMAIGETMTRLLK